MLRPVFVIPHYSQTERSWQFLDRTLASVLDQTDPEWEAVVVDDCSPSGARSRLLDAARAVDPVRIHVVQQERNAGPGSARNAGIAWAHERGAPFVLFLDADDRAHPRRLQLTRDCFERRLEVGFVYSTFEVMDEHEQAVGIDEITPSIREILNGHASNPVEGPDQWLRVALEKGYTTCTSTVSVRTLLASAQPFPCTYVSEDSHTWLRMLATGITIAFVNAPLARRRICSSAVRGSSTRQRFGDNFYWIKLQVDLDGFTRALEIARARGTIDEADAARIRRGFHLRQARTMAGERQELAAAVCNGLAALPVATSESVLQTATAAADTDRPYGDHDVVSRRPALGRR
jgi:glycosyltransferase involved in cell wall biosynthesis